MSDVTHFIGERKHTPTVVTVAQYNTFSFKNGAKFSCPAYSFSCSRVRLSGLFLRLELISSFHFWGSCFFASKRLKSELFLEVSFSFFLKICSYEFLLVFYWIPQVLSFFSSRVTLILSSRQETVFQNPNMQERLLHVLNLDTHRANIAAFLGHAKTPTEPIRRRAKKTRIFSNIDTRIQKIASGFN
jgi:hypothetical protein